MSIGKLLARLALVPPPPREGNAREPANVLICRDSSLGSPSSPKHSTTLSAALEEICGCYPIDPDDAIEALTLEDIEAWNRGEISQKLLQDFVRTLAQHRTMDEGVRPGHYTEHATCKRCGPVWLWFSGEVQGCPWCRNRLSDRPIPRPSPTLCGDYVHFERIDHLHLGHCSKDESEAIAGLWDTDQRYCERFLARPERSNTGQSRPVSDETKR